MPVQGTAGYSLIELLVAMTLFAIAALGLSAGVALIAHSSASSDSLTRATLLAQDKLEELTADDEPRAGGADLPEPGFSRSWIISPDTPQAGVTRIDVTVSWEHNETQAITLVTVVNE